MSSYSVAYSIIKKLYEEGYIAYFAGGWVRDFLMDHPPDDIDIATDAPVEDIQRIFPKTIPVGVAFGIVIIVQEGHQYEIATFRSDQGYKDGRRPIGIERTTPENDAQRRDFTINGMFYDPIHKKLYDFVEGQKDLQKGVIRAIGNPHKRFLEDRLRMIRAVRYASRFNFSIEQETLEALLDHAEDLFPAVAIERVWNELTKMGAFPHFDSSLLSLHRLNLLTVIFPALQDISIEQIQQRVQYIPSFPDDAPMIAKILELFPNSTLEEKKKLCLYLKLSNHDHQFILFYHKATHMFSKQKHSSLFDWAHLYAHSFYAICLKICAIHLPIEERQTFLQEHHMRISELRGPIQKIQKKIPFLSSEDLRQAGIPNGRQMGLLLKEGERLAINASLQTPEAIIKRLKNTPLWTI